MPAMILIAWVAWMLAAGVMLVVQMKGIIRPRGKYGNSASSDLRGNTTRATLVALFHYRLGVTWIGVLLWCTFDGTITISTRSPCTHNGFALDVPSQKGVKLAWTMLLVGTSKRHWLNPINLFNPSVLELQTGFASVGRNLNTCQ